MRHKILIFSGILVSILLIFAGITLAGEKWPAVESGVAKEAARARQDAALTKELVKKDKQTLIARLSELKTQIRAEEAALKELKAQFDTLGKQEVELKKELENEHKEVADVEGSVRGALKDAASMVRDNPITTEDPGRSKLISDMIASQKFPGLAGIQAIVDLYFNEFAAGGQIKRYPGKFINTDGRMADGDIIRAGRFTCYYLMPDGTVGFLTPEPDGQKLSAVAGQAPGAALAAVKNYFAGQGSVLPIDPSGGAVFAQMTRKTDFKEVLDQGGILMWPILIVAGLALLLILERIVVLGTTKSNTDKITDKLAQLAEDGDWQGCQQMCESKKQIPTCRMLNSALALKGHTQEILENALQEAMLREMPRLERFLPTLAVLAAIAPLLGLLGTVTGMINTFKVITVMGTGDPRMMSGGISEALLTTQFGLAVAIPIMLIHHFLKRRVDKIAGDMEEKGTAFAVTMMKSGTLSTEEK
ncbi:DUF3450 family protein [uncultured Desulfobacter sp.]|uniref:MotA/TolQ/ExbB proton channel family protein n=1 Tax=uncultured Desulfobacter sp. TaxID=240139 RepID=UPI002AAC3675|nr:DUF3450 family protein [uncultured Desulfobacter sp.]